MFVWFLVLLMIYPNLGVNLQLIFEITMKNLEKKAVRCSFYTLPLLFNGF